MVTVNTERVKSQENVFRAFFSTVYTTFVQNSPLTEKLNLILVSEASLLSRFNGGIFYVSRAHYRNGLQYTQNMCEIILS